jgi:hypothetical protein
VAGRAAMAGRENVGRLKVIVRGAEIAGARETLACPTRARAGASVGTRHELPSSATAMIVRIEVRIIMEVSTRGFGPSRREFALHLPMVNALPQTDGTLS